MSPRPAAAILVAALALLALAPAEAQQRQQRRAAPSAAMAQPLLTVQTDLPASCRVVDGFGASRSREFGTPATIRLEPRRPDDVVVCVRDGRESRVAVPGGARSVAVPVSGAGAAPTPVRRAVTVGEVHPYPGRIALRPQVEYELVYLRQRYEEGRISERDYFKLRREAIARNDDGRAAPGNRRAAPRRIARTR